jgi:hypothetical protein
MIRSFFSVAVSAFVVGTFSTSADAAQVLVRSTNLGGGLTESFVYGSLAQMASNTGGQSLGTPSTINYQDGIWTDGNHVYKTTRTDLTANYNNAFIKYTSLSNLAANDSFNNLLNNNPFYTSGFGGGAQNGANKYWGNAGIDNSPVCYNSVVVNGVVTAFRTYARGNDMFNNDSSSTLSSFAYSDSDRFMTIDSSMVPTPGAIALLAIVGVGAKGRRRA